MKTRRWRTGGSPGGGAATKPGSGADGGATATATTLTRGKAGGAAVRFGVDNGAKGATGDGVHDAAGRFIRGTLCG